MSCGSEVHRNRMDESVLILANATGSNGIMQFPFIDHQDRGGRGGFRSPLLTQTTDGPLASHFSQLTLSRLTSSPHGLQLDQQEQRTGSSTPSSCASAKGPSCRSFWPLPRKFAVHRESVKQDGTGLAAAMCSHLLLLLACSSQRGMLLPPEEDSRETATASTTVIRHWYCHHSISGRPYF